jgi:hypothetical protein
LPRLSHLAELGFRKVKLLSRRWLAIRNQHPDHESKSMRPSRMVDECEENGNVRQAFCLIISKIQFNGVAG